VLYQQIHFCILCLIWSCKSKMVNHYTLHYLVYRQSTVNFIAYFCSYKICSKILYSALEINLLRQNNQMFLLPSQVPQNWEMLMEPANWQLHMPWPFCPGESVPDTHWTGSWVGPRISLNILEKREISCPFQKLKTNYSVLQPIAWSL
jgi:hypothetical protein